MTGLAKASLAEGGCVSFWCPGCDEAHTIGPSWDFNNDLFEPTIQPSVKVTSTQWEKSYSFYRPQHARVPAGQQTCCHSFVTNGRIQFLGDCTHDLAGQTVDLPEWKSS